MKYKRKYSDHVIGPSILYKEKKTFFIKKKQNIKFNGDIAKFFDANVFSYVGSDFTVCKGAF